MPARVDVICVNRSYHHELFGVFFFFSSRRRHTRFDCDWSSDVCSSDLHNTPLLVLYGSNLGTAEELATRVADLAEVNGFATKLAPLDDFVGKLPEKGGVLIFCSSYNGAPPDNATRFIKWLGSDLPKDAFSKVRYGVFGCGNSDWAATYQSIPRTIDEQLAAHGARSAYARGEGDARSDLDGQFE